MAAANLITLPSYMEGCPNVVLEALASGRPVVATNVGGIPEILSKECGELVPPRDAAALAKALASVLDRSWDAGAISALAQCVVIHAVRRFAKPAAGSTACWPPSVWLQL